MQMLAKITRIGFVSRDYRRCIFGLAYFGRAQCQCGHLQAMRMVRASRILVLDFLRFTTTMYIYRVDCHHPFLEPCRVSSKSSWPF